MWPDGARGIWDGAEGLRGLGGVRPVILAAVSPCVCYCALLFELPSCLLPARRNLNSAAETERLLAGCTRCVAEGTPPVNGGDVEIHFITSLTERRPPVYVAGARSGSVTHSVTL